MIHSDDQVSAWLAEAAAGLAARAIAYQAASERLRAVLEFKLMPFEAAARAYFAGSQRMDLADIALSSRSFLFLTAPFGAALLGFGLGSARSAVSAWCWNAAASRLTFHEGLDGPDAGWLAASAHPWEARADAWARPQLRPPGWCVDMVLGDGSSMPVPRDLAWRLEDDVGRRVVYESVFIASREALRSFATALPDLAGRRCTADSLPPPLFANFLSGSLPGPEVPAAVAAERARSLLAAWPGAMRLFEAMPADAAAGHVSAAQLMTRIGRGETGALAFEAAGLPAPYFLEGVPEEAVAGFLGMQPPSAAVLADEIAFLNSLPPTELPRDWTQGEMLRALRAKDLLTEARACPGGWKSVLPPPAVGLVPWLDRIHAYRQWFSEVVEALAADPAGVAWQLAGVSLDRYGEFAAAWRDGYAGWLQRMADGIDQFEARRNEGEGFSASGPAMWIPLVQRGDALARLIPEGWSGLEITSEQDLRGNGAFVDQDSGRFAQGCILGRSRVFSLTDGAAQIHVEVGLSNSIRLKQMRWTGLPAAAAQRAGERFVAALNVEMEAYRRSSASGLVPAAVRIMLAAAGQSDAVPRDIWAGDIGARAGGRVTALLRRYGADTLAGELGRFLVVRFPLREAG